jgi:hypothetical protein
MQFFAILLLSSLSLSSAKATERITSFYTPLSGEGCILSASSEWDEDAEIDYFKSECVARPMFRVFHNGGDLRSWIEIQFNEQPVVSLFGDIMDNAPGSFAHVSGTKLEWRTLVNGANETPFALIFRVAGQDESDEDPNSFRDIENLLIAKVAGSKVCVIGVIRATGNPRANLEARELADSQARAAVCPNEQ